MDWSGNWPGMVAMAVAVAIMVVGAGLVYGSRQDRDSTPLAAGCVMLLVCAGLYSGLHVLDAFLGHFALSVWH